VEKLIGDR